MSEELHTGMKSLTIRDLERYSGIRSHTIRIWEQRYGALRPTRTCNNARLYSPADLERLLVLSFLSSHGHRISSLAPLNTELLKEKAGRFSFEEEQAEIAVGCMLLAKVQCDAEGLNAIIDDYIERWNIDTAIRRLLIPFMIKAGLLSFSDRTGETHYAITLLRRKFILATELLGALAGQRKTALLFLADGEHYDLILLYLDYQLRKAGIRTFYLGTNVPSAHLLCTIADKQPDLLVTYCPSQRAATLEQLSALPDTIRQRLWVTYGTTSPEHRFAAINCIHFERYAEIS